MTSSLRLSYIPGRGGDVGPFYHTGESWMPGASFRVERFFVLSGLLSPALMLTLPRSLWTPPLLQQLRSLGAEEQFYVLWPSSLLFLLHRLKGNRIGLLAATALMVAASSIGMAVLTSPAADPLRIYYGTDTRAAGGAQLKHIYA